MREEANPRKFLRRTVAYGASQLPITFSHSGSHGTVLAPLFTPRTVDSLKASKSIRRPAFLFNTNGAIQNAPTAV